MRLTKKQKLFVELVKKVWENREDGTHGYFPYRDKFIAIEPYEDEENDYMNIILCEKLDYMGTAYGQYFNYAELSEHDIYNDEYLVEFFKDLVLKKNWHYGQY